VIIIVGSGWSALGWKIGVAGGVELSESPLSLSLSLETGAVAGADRISTDGVIAIACTCDCDWVGSSWVVDII